MTGEFEIILDGIGIPAVPGETVIRAADRAGIYIPRLCWLADLEPFGGCRVCTVRANGRFVTACTQPAAPGMVIENDTDELAEERRRIVEMLFISGNHFCMFCEKSGRCELQAMAYRLGIASPRFPYRFPAREVDATHEDILLDRNRCILCGRCVRASREVDGKSVFAFAGRGLSRRIVAGSSRGIGGTAAVATDRALEVCPVGALLRKRVGFDVPIGERKYDRQPIGSEIESPDLAEEENR